jgi:hypothetical protein
VYIKFTWVTLAASTLSLRVAVYIKVSSNAHSRPFGKWRIEYLSLKGERKKNTYVHICIYIYIFIYLYIKRTRSTTKWDVVRETQATSSEDPNYFRSRVHGNGLIICLTKLSSRTPRKCRRHWTRRSNSISKSAGYSYVRGCRAAKAAKRTSLLPFCQ